MPNNPIEFCKDNSGVIIVVVIIILFIIFFTVPVRNGMSCFANVKASIGGTNIKELDLVMFMSGTCPWCKKMIDVLKSEGQINNVTIVDISTPEGAGVAKQYGADKQPVPSFISRKLKTGTVGFRPTVAELVDALNGKESKDTNTKPGTKEQAPQQPLGKPSMEPEFIGELGVIAFTRDGCGYCDKAKSAIQEQGLSEVIRIVDITTEEGASMAKQLLPKGIDGVPVFFSTKTNNNAVGFRDLESVIQQLTST